MVRDDRTGAELLTFKESFIFYDAQSYINTSKLSLEFTPVHEL